MFVGLTLAWGASFLFIKIGLNEGLEPFTLVAWRMVMATLFLARAARRDPRRHPPRTRRAAPRWRRWRAQRGDPGAAHDMGRRSPYRRRSRASSTASLPLFAVVLAALVLPDEPMTVDRLAGAAGGLRRCGAAGLAQPRPDGTGRVPTDALLGEIAVTLAALGYAVAAVYARRIVTGRAAGGRAGRGPRRATAAEIALAQVVTRLPSSRSRSRPSLRASGGGIMALPPTPAAWGSVLWLGVSGRASRTCCSSASCVRGARCARRLVTYALPVMGIALGVIVLDERLHAEELAGTALVLDGAGAGQAPGGGARVLFARAATDARLIDPLGGRSGLRMRDQLSRPCIISDDTHGCRAARRAMDSAGYRLTEPRRAVAELIAAREGHFSAADLIDDARVRRLGIGRATVFRALDLLTELGVLERLDLPNGEHAYVPCEPVHHHHVVCSVCGRVTRDRRPGPGGGGRGHRAGAPAGRSRAIGWSSTAGAPTAAPARPAVTGHDTRLAETRYPSPVAGGARDDVRDSHSSLADVAARGAQSPADDRAS